MRSDVSANGSSKNTFGNRRLAAEDDLGHIYLFDVPKPSNSEVMRTPLHIHALWDGHKELVFHISVDPYSQRMATHSIEGELLIWDTLSTAVTEPETNGHIQQTLLLSRKMALDGSQIRTIAWAPTDSEFIAATDKQVYRLAFDSSTMQWVPSDFTLPQVKAYDRIFTYPSEISEATEKPGKQLPYFISSVRNSTRTIQTWKVPVNGKDIEYVGSFNLSHASHFDLASRVMPVPYPFFSLDNILATFNAESGKLRIWGIRTTPKFVWFCSKEHLLPCMNVKMIRYNSIDKAAIVSAEKDGSQVITIWVFSSTSRESHYLPAGTIHPRRKTDCVREIRWHLTDYAQTYLGIQWDDRIDVYCQERNLDDAWACILSIHASEYGADKSLGSFSFTASGEPIFSIEKQLVLCSEVVPNSTKRISDVAFDAHGELPMIHPFVLTELLSWGKMDIVKRLLSSLYDYMRQIEINGSTQSALPVVSLCELIADGTSSTRNSTRANKNMLSKYSGLFASDATSDDIFQIDGSEPDFGRFNTEKAEYLLEKLTEIKIKGISAIEQAHLSSIVGTISASLIKDQPLDEMGLRYMLKLHLLEIENKRQRSLSELPYRELNWALHSNSQAIMLQTCLQQHASSGLTWESARRMGLFMWLSDTNVLHSEVEKMARNMFIVENRDPTKCAIFYLALKKQRLLHGLWRIAHNHPERNKMLAFLSHDFSEARWKTAAAKNAYVLLSKQRYMDAATFFMLSDKLTDAATVCITQLKDIQLAITICRCYEGENGPVLKDITWKHVLPDAFKRQDRWLASLAFGILHKYDLVLQSLTDDLSQLATHIGISAQVSIYSPMNVLDTELLILYRSMLGHSPHYRAPLIVQAQLIASTITIFECLGVPVMALVVLEWWRKELFDITKRLELKAKPLHATPPTATPTAASIANSINTGTLDMSAFSGFGGFSSTSSSNGNPPAPSVPDPLASGMLSMDSFGSTFSEMFMGASKTSSGASGQDDALPNGVNLGLRSSSSSTSTTRNKANPSSDSTTNTLDDATLAMDIEDTPVQYACRVMLALQIADYIRRVCKSNGGGATTPAPSTSAKPSEGDGVRDPNTSFTTTPKPARKQKKGHKIRNTTILTLLAGSGFVAAAAYAQEDSEFGQQFEHYVPGAKSFMRLIKHHDDSLVMALSDVGYKVYDDLAYTGRFVYEQMSGLVNMLQHNNWHAPSDDSTKDAGSGRKHEAVAPTSPKGSRDGSVAGSHDKQQPVSPVAAVPANVVQLAVEIPPLASENEAVVALSKSLNAVVSALNNRGLSPDEFQQLNTLSDALIALDKHLSVVKDEEKQIVENALAEEREKFEKVLADFQETAQLALASREAQLIEARDEQLRAAAVAAEERIGTELSAQRDLLERRFNRFVRARVDEERGGRLAHLDRVDSQLLQLTQTVQESGDLIRQSRGIAKLGVALVALRNAAVDSKAQMPFVSELMALASAATTDFPATRAAISLIPRDVAEQGIPSQVELEDRFDAVRKEIRGVSLVPENGNFGSQVLSATLSKVMFEKEGLVEGADVEAVLARTSYYLKDHNLDLATRELNQLKGWPKKLAEDWISAARRRLEIEQAVGIAETEEMLAKITFV
ncbi:regulator of (H+)-ATPase in vacuolar membrane [Coemansia sp. RSA 487]|nr:regulator of (H+)-ATPase in vacuolar membrane [Coemansia sp. RSA 487]